MANGRYNDSMSPKAELPPQSAEDRERYASSTQSLKHPELVNELLSQLPPERIDVEHLDGHLSLLDEYIDNGIHEQKTKEEIFETIMGSAVTEAIKDTGYSMRKNERRFASDDTDVEPSPVDDASFVATGKETATQLGKIDAIGAQVAREEQLAGRGVRMLKDRLRNDSAPADTQGEQYQGELEKYHQQISQVKAVIPESALGVMSEKVLNKEIIRRYKALERQGYSREDIIPQLSEDTWHVLQDRQAAQDRAEDARLVKLTAQEHFRAVHNESYGQTQAESVVAQQAQDIEQKYAQPDTKSEQESSSSTLEQPSETQEPRDTERTSAEASPAETTEASTAVTEQQQAMTVVNSIEDKHTEAILNAYKEGKKEVKLKEKDEQGKEQETTYVVSDKIAQLKEQLRTGAGSTALDNLESKTDQKKVDSQRMLLRGLELRENNKDAYYVDDDMNIVEVEKMSNEAYQDKRERVDKLKTHKDSQMRSMYREEKKEARDLYRHAKFVDRLEDAMTRRSVLGERIDEINRTLDSGNYGWIETGNKMAQLG